MILKKIKLQNFGGHSLIEADMNASIVGILGPNGSGKSTILAAIEYAFTGMLRDKAETYIKDFDPEKSKQKASVYVEFQKDGQSGSIERTIAGQAKRRLEWEGQVYTSAKDVDQMLTEIFGADRQAISNAIFIPQGELDKLLFGNQAEREQLFVKLMLLTHLERVSLIADGKIRHLQTGLQDLTAVKDEVTAARERAINAYDQAKKDLTSYTDLSPTIDRVKSFQTCEQALLQAQSEVRQQETIVRQCQERIHGITARWGNDLDVIYEDYITQRNTLQHQITSAENNRLHFTRKDRLQKEINEATSAKQDLLNILSQYNKEALREEWDTLKAKQNEGYEINDLYVKLEAAEAEHRDVLNTLLSLLETKPAGILSEDKRKEVETDLKTATEVYFTQKSTYDTLHPIVHKHEGADHCPVCHQPVNESIVSQERLVQVKKAYEEAKSKMDELTRTKNTSDAAISSHNSNVENARNTQQRNKKKVDDLKTALAGREKLDVSGLTTRLSELTDIFHKIQTSETELSRLNSLIEDRTKQLAECKDVKESELLTQTSLDEIRQQLTALDAKLESLKNDRSAMKNPIEDKRNAESRLTSLTDQVVKLDNQKQKLREELPDNTPVNDPDKLSALLSELNQKQDYYDQAAGVVKEADRNMRAASHRYLEIEKRLEANVDRMSLIDDLRRIKESFSRGGLPLAVIRDRFEIVAELTREHLATMESNFTVESDPDVAVSFMFQRTDTESDYCMPQTKLSGGQRVRLTVAFLFALQQVVVSDIGFLVLDEPSSHLDDEGVNSLKDMFLTLQEKLNSSESQVLIVDHNKDLETSLQQCIRLLNKD